MFISTCFDWDRFVYGQVDGGDVYEALDKVDGRIPELLVDVSELFGVPVSELRTKVDGRLNHHLTVEFEGATLEWDHTVLKEICDDDFKD